MAQHFFEIDDDRFSSQATTLEDIYNDPVTILEHLTMENILQILNVVSVGCFSKIANYPDASICRVYSLTYISITNVIQLNINARDLTINNAIAIFDSIEIGNYLNKYADTILKISGSIGRRKIITNVLMNFAYTIIAGIRRMTHDLNKNKCSLHVIVFQKLVKTAESFIGNYFDKIEQILTTEKDPRFMFYLGPTCGISKLIVPIINFYKSGNGNKEQVAAFLRSIYSYEVYKNITTQNKKKVLHTLFRINPNFEITKDINYDYLETLMNPINYLSVIIPLFAMLIESIYKYPQTNIQDLPAIDDCQKRDRFGINYSLKEFYLFNLFHALKYGRNRFQSKNMKIIDTEHRDLLIEEIKIYVWREYQKIYQTSPLKCCDRGNPNEYTDVRKIVAKLICSFSEEELTLLIQQVTKSYSARLVKYFLKQLKINLLNRYTFIRFRVELIYIYLRGINSKGEQLINNGNGQNVKHIYKFKNLFFESGGTEEAWSEIVSWRNKMLRKYTTP